MATHPHSRNALQHARQRRGLSQAQVARLLNCKDRRTIARYERGKQLPSLTRAMALALIFQLPVEELFPALAARIRIEVTRREEIFHDTYQSPSYVPTPDTTTIVAIYPGTRKIGIAIFEAFPAR